MHTVEKCFTSFKHSVAELALPERFTFPFCYQPHPLCLLATKELQQQLENNELLQREFAQTGKMLGVLLVENKRGEIGYLNAFSGKQSGNELARQIDINFVPAVADLDQQNEFFQAQSKIINKLNDKVERLSAAPQITGFQLTITSLLAQQDEQFAKQRSLMSVNKQVRKGKRDQAKATLFDTELAQCLKKLAQESVADKNQLRDLKHYWTALIAQTQAKLSALTDEIDAIKKQRKQLSTRLQKQLFKQYRLLNSAGTEKNLMEIFQSTPFPIPPAGTGDCAAPKLLQYAFRHDLKPLALAEFWWGKAPQSEIRQHKKFYGACSGKCQPILTHMLAGIKIDDNPLLVNPASGKTLEIVYQDGDIVVVNKPSEFLSVPGKNIEDSVYLRIKQQFPNATGSLIVHRLDMSTSGIMVLALTKRAQKHLQQQFINRSIKKRYVAMLEGDLSNNIKQDSGEINLPLRGDLTDRPRQLVCFEHGKTAKTHWEVISRGSGKTKLYLYPESGRTHQLRVHCAHAQGLNIPILGDDLYGSECFDSHSTNKENIAQRLHLHAQKLTLSHPITKELMTFEVDCEF